MDFTNAATVVYTLDDLCVFNPTDPAYNPAVLTNNVVVETSFPSGDAQKQFTNDGNVVWPTGIVANGVYRSTASIIVVTAGSLVLLKFIPVVACTLNSVTFMGANGTSLGASKWRGVAYTNARVCDCQPSAWGTRWTHLHSGHFPERAPTSRCPALPAGRYGYSSRSRAGLSGHG
jgi:hypothetical protein